MHAHAFQAAMPRTPHLRSHPFPAIPLAYRYKRSVGVQLQPIGQGGIWGLGVEGQRWERSSWKGGISLYI